MGLSVLFVHALIDALERSGVPRERFLEALPFDRAELDRADARCDVGTFDAAAEVAASMSGDPALGLHVLDLLSPVHYNLTAHLILHATTLRDAIDSLQKFHQLLNDRAFCRFAEDDHSASLFYDASTGSSFGHRFRSELTMTSFYRLLTYFAPHARPRVVAFDYPPPSYQAEYTRLFGGAERFAQAFAGIVLDRALLASAALHPDRELHATMVSHAERRMAQIRSDAGYAERIRQHILSSARHDRHDMRTVARALGLSARSLRRRLAEEGTSFREIVDDALGALARRLVSDEGRPIEAVAYAMGFSHPSAFHRAFKRWTGATPAQLRKRR